MRLTAPFTAPCASARAPSGTATAESAAVSIVLRSIMTVSPGNEIKGEIGAMIMQGRSGHRSRSRDDAAEHQGATRCESAAVIRRA